MDIRPCKACYQCLFGEEKCPQPDDFALVLETLAQADALVVAAPTYLLGANASLKRFLDRGLSFYAQLDRLWGKPAVGVAIAGIEGMEGCTKLNVESFIRLTLGEIRGSDVVYGALPGEIFLRPGGKETARRLAAALTEGKEKVQPAAPSLSDLRRRHLPVSARWSGALHVVQQCRRLCLAGRPAPTWRRSRANMPSS